MFVSDRVKVRSAALVMAAAALFQVWPAADGVARPGQATAREAESKTPKKTRKREPAHAPSKKRLDPVKVALNVAYKQIGKPYRWASAGPNAFDCSGFTSYVWKKAGVGLPRTSGQQAAALKRVSLDKMEPGDLIFSRGHVGMFVGKGKMIHSPHSGRSVSIDPIHSNAYAAGRPTG